MNRAEQRRISVLSGLIADAKRGGQTTRLATLALGADELETLIDQTGVELVDDHSPLIRRRMAVVGHAMPDGSFPIETPDDAVDAIQHLDRVTPSNRARVEAHIRKRVHALRCTGEIYDRWK